MIAVISHKNYVKFRGSGQHRRIYIKVLNTHHTIVYFEGITKSDQELCYNRNIINCFEKISVIFQQSGYVGSSKQGVRVRCSIFWPDKKLRKAFLEFPMNCSPVKPSLAGSENILQSTVI